MNPTTTSTGQTLFSKAMFDSLFEKLEGDGADVEIKRVCGALSNRGYSNELLFDKVREALGAAAADRVKRICLGDAAIRVPGDRAPQRFRVSRRKRLALRFLDLKEDLDDALSWVASGVQKLIRRRS